MVDRSTIYAEFLKLAPPRSVKKLRELSRREGVDIDIQVDLLKINCIWSYMDLSVAVTTTIDSDSWTSGWAAIFYVFEYFEGKNEQQRQEDIVNSPRQITWLIENFDKIYSLMCDPDRSEEKQGFFEFQASAYREESERQVAALKDGRSV